MVFREGEDVVVGVNHDLGVGGGQRAEEADHLLHLRRRQWGGRH